jgi:DNA polymerase
LESCKPYLERQIAAINPDVIVTLGRFSMGHFIQNGKISSIHGRSFWSNGRMIIPMYHPAAALHQPSLRSVVVADFKNLSEMIETAKVTRSNNPDLASISEVDLLEDSQDDHGTEQLSLF